MTFLSGQRNRIAQWFGVWYIGGGSETQEGRTVTDGELYALIDTDYDACIEAFAAFAEDYTTTTEYIDE
jgi:hypothetical protein